MTTINLKIRNGIVNLKIEGHAGFNPGNDIVCSAISQLACTFGKLCAEKTIVYKMIIDDAIVEIIADTTEKINAYIEFICAGFEMLEEAYKENVLFVLEN